MMVFLSCYTIVDGFFIASFVGKEAFAAVNLVFPILMAAGTGIFLFLQKHGELWKGDEDDE